MAQPIPLTRLPQDTIRAILQRLVNKGLTAPFTLEITDTKDRRVAGRFFEDRNPEPIGKGKPMRMQGSVFFWRKFSSFRFLV